MSPLPDFDDPYVDVPHPADGDVDHDLGGQPVVLAADFRQQASAVLERPPNSPLVGVADGLVIVDPFAAPSIEDALVDGLTFRARWLLLVAAAKVGKSTFLINAAVGLARGVDPFGDGERGPVDVLYIDGEMGRADMRERLEDLGISAGDLTHFHYTDLPPKLNTVEGAAKLVATCQRMNPAVVIIDGLNGVITGAEKDDTPWRDLYEWAIAPLKAMNVAVVTAANLGKDRTLGPRGSSVLQDKPDAIVRIDRTDDGVKLTTTHRRTTAYPLEQAFTVSGVDSTDPITFRRSSDSWPPHTKRVADLLDRLGVPLAATNTTARQAIKAAGETAKNDAIAAALRSRRAHGVRL